MLEIEWIAGNSELETRAIDFLQERNEIDRTRNAVIGFKETYGFLLKPQIAAAREEIVETLN
ncbi:hypothetical protein TSTA_061180 [Talaromyces stipitatus ATCC 10500]|uniref:Uncharacterized protein n=1 Tax=Talaromyces stipitatus (strain ATCC 10500 / CBS 375.48 / QM 6759 / NRRL 1006) TaxID=441959 RepID=B8LV06_TALSN|nr:uncharacterized protein TSTA_061180 [Talaromyces stipitatus ATCC 10500]EED22627.1 hypothetical protein TSTA_061180 [Talaromyces stipitatus ATCC 10500]